MVTDLKVNMATSSGTPGDIGRRYLQASVDSILRGGMSLVISGLVPMMLARYLGPHDYGIYSIITALSALIAGLFHMGHNSALHKLLPEYYLSDRVRGGAILANVMLFTLALAAVVCLSFMLGAPLIAAKVYHNQSMTPFFRFCALLILVMTLLNLASSIAAGMQDFKAYNTALLLRSGMLIISAWIGATWWGLWGALVSQFMAGSVGLVWLARQVIKVASQRFPKLIRPVFSREILGVIGAFMLPAFTMTLLNLPCYWLANTLTAREQGFAQAGLFSAAYALAQLISLAPFNFYTPAMTFLTEAQASANAEVFNKLVVRSFRSIWLLTLPIALGCALFSPLLIRLLFGSNYLAAIPAAVLMSIAGLFMAIVGLLNAVIAAAGRIWHGCGITFIWALVFVAAAFLLIPRWGAMGAAATFAISYVLYLLLLCLYLQAILRVSLREMRRLAVLTIGSCSVALPLVYTCRGMTLYLAAPVLLAGVAIIGIFWVCDEVERKACELSLTRFRQAVLS